MRRLHRGENDVYGLGGRNNKRRKGESFSPQKERDELDREGKNF